MNTIFIFQFSIVNEKYVKNYLKFKITMFLTINHDDHECLIPLHMIHNMLQKYSSIQFNVFTFINHDNLYPYHLIISTEGVYTNVKYSMNN